MQLVAMLKRLFLFSLGAVLLNMSGTGLADQSTVEGRSALSAVGGYEGRIRLIRYLDEPDGYCIDIPGNISFLLPFPAWAHTCHFDRVPDQVFRYNRDGKHNIRWIYEDSKQKFDWCLTAKSKVSGSYFEYATCDQPSLQEFEYTDLGEFKLKDSDFCIYVESTGPIAGKLMLPGGDPYGRGRSINPAYSHLARILELQPCGSGEISMERWEALIE
ncbi:ricin-type beta-trefoil lectin domain protein [Novosphingobium pentaromativorans]|uniref:ricin-type beta-trefoil lectin domain protein n=1 Tax=Novosphingobium pentaromativorans TaxID=205844 RepID=UPI000A802346|nr:ricin-type beta-trefoil lectin domain protein [Novosphingobium pentaromativorans]